ncbi:MAG TPA: hypothetical protein IGS52_20540 [Oscillatoriaceae cyanobacterium M33_DOE_052]|nr:hypothetical protein [Oscillatoriaceae cyanobacterium M33_DOE_052]
MIISYQLIVDRWQGGWQRSRSPWTCDSPQRCPTPFCATIATSHHHQ